MILPQSKTLNKIEDILGNKTRIKILIMLVINKELNITQIIKKSKSNHPRVTNHLTFLKKLNLIKEKRFGRSIVYKYRKDNTKAKSLKNFLKNLIEIWE